MEWPPLGGGDSYTHILYSHSCNMLKQGLIWVLLYRTVCTGKISLLSSQISSQARHNHPEASAHVVLVSDSLLVCVGSPVLVHEVHIVCLGVQHSCSKFILCGRGGATYQYLYLWKNYVQGNCQHLISAVSLSLLQCCLLSLTSSPPKQVRYHVVMITLMSDRMFVSTWIYSSDVTKSNTLMPYCTAS